MGISTSSIVNQHDKEIYLHERRKPYLTKKDKYENDNSARYNITPIENDVFKDYQ